jgi:hypothetical protein
VTHLQQWLIVGPLVAAALLFAGWRLMTVRLRLRCMSRLLQWLPAASTGPVARWRAAVARQIAADAASSSGCAACSKH